MSRQFITTTIPYVNAAPHLGYALEAVQADVLARHARLRGNHVRLLSGTDDNSLKNVLAAETAGADVQAFVTANGDRFAALAGPLSIRYDDFIRTSTDPRHRPGVEELWQACADDLYQGRYEGLYCVGCEAYLSPDELDAGRCPEHLVAPQHITEQNWFFRLSRYAEPIRDAITSGRLRIEPPGRRNEVLAFLDSGVRDISVSRSAGRARGWGIPVPGDPDQVIYVWFDALANYINSLRDGLFERWWNGADRRTHILGKGVVRFHAVYWPAILLSAGLKLPTDLLVHEYVGVDGAKISKSAGTAISPLTYVTSHGVDALRWWLLRDVARIGDTDFTVAKLEARAREDLTGGFGNLVHRVVTLIHKSGAETLPAPTTLPACVDVPSAIDAALEIGDFRTAAASLRTYVDAANRHIETTTPWRLRGDDQAAVLADLLDACRTIGRELSPFLPDAAARITAQCTPVDGALPAAVPVFTAIPSGGTAHTAARTE
ncbi:MAG TPA: methionine--tRNA ligase [Micromonosporaceae bacterium]